VAEQAQSIGTVGDCTLFNPQHFVRMDKGELQAASSMHVRFVTDEMTYRYTQRTDGQPWWKQPIQPFHGNNTLSAFVQLLH
jgi:hypothetical protein